MDDHFEHFTVGLESPAAAAAAVVPSDEADLAVLPRAFFATGAGDLRVTMHSGAVVTLPILAGPPLCIRARRVWATGTDATGIVGVW